MELAIFDLDNTLISGDTSKLWNEFVFEQGLTKDPEHLARLQRFYHDYADGCMDIDAYQRYTMQLFPLLDSQQLLLLRDDYLRKKIEPVILPDAEKLLATHYRSGHCRVLISATNRFLTEPLRERWDMEVDLSTEPAVSEGLFTGQVRGIPSFGPGKVDNLQRWIMGQPKRFEAIHFYSDSHNDLPLLNWVDHPVVVDPDPQLRRHAQDEGWPVISLRASA